MKIGFSFIITEFVVLQRNMMGGVSMGLYLKGSGNESKKHEVVLFNHCSKWSKFVNFKCLLGLFELLSFVSALLSHMF